MPRSTSREKILEIEFQGGRCHLVDEPGAIYNESERLARELGGHYMDQFTYAERATDWRANNNIAESIFSQLCLERYPQPSWLVASAGTGGTLATLGRYVRYHVHGKAQTGGNAATLVCGADAERSVFYDHYLERDSSLTLPHGSRIEGIGRPRVEPSFMPDVLDAMVKVPDLWSLAAMHALSRTLGRPVGGSSGTNLVASLAVAQHMQARGQQGSIVSILCDSGQRYANTYFNADWLANAGLACGQEQTGVADWMQTGRAPAAMDALRTTL